MLVGKSVPQVKLTHSLVLHGFQTNNFFFTFLRGCKKQIRIWKRDHIWPIEPKILTTGPFKGKNLSTSALDHLNMA